MDQMETLCLVLQETIETSSKVLNYFYIPTRITMAQYPRQRFILPQSSLNILICVQWYLLVLICISLATHVKHLFLCLFTICISSLMWCLFRSFVYFLIGLFIFVLLNFKSSLYIFEYILHQRSLLQNIFSQSVACLHICLTELFIEQKF